MKQGSINIGTTKNNVDDGDHTAGGIGAGFSGIRGASTLQSASISRADNGSDDELRHNNNNDTDLKQQDINDTYMSSTDVTKRSKKILSEMDSDNDGIVTYNDAAIYGKQKEKQIKQLKLLFIGAILLLLITYAVIFGLFMLGFNLTKIFDIDNSDGNNNALVSNSDGSYVSTSLNSIEVDVSMYEYGDNEYRIDWIYAVFDNKYFSVHVSYMTIDYDNDNDNNKNPSLLTLYDNTGNIKIEYYYNNSNLILYQTLDNGTIATYKNFITSENERRLLSANAALWHANSFGLNNFLINGQSWTPPTPMPAAAVAVRPAMPVMPAGNCVNYCQFDSSSYSYQCNVSGLAQMHVQ